MKSNPAAVVLGQIQATDQEIGRVLHRFAVRPRGGRFILTGSVDDGSDAVYDPALIRMDAGGAFEALPLAIVDVYSFVASDIMHLESGVSVSEDAIIIDPSVPRTESNEIDPSTATQASRVPGASYIGEIIDITVEHVLQSVDGVLVTHMTDEFVDAECGVGCLVEITYEYDGPRIRVLSLL